MKIIETTDNIKPLQRNYIYELWNSEYPAAIAYHSISQLDDYLEKLSDVHHYFLREKGSMIGWAITFTREDEKWFAVIVDSGFQGKGRGSIILNHLKKHHSELNGWVIGQTGYLKADGTEYKAPLHFYLKHGFKMVEGVQLDVPQMKAVKIRWCS